MTGSIRRRTLLTAGGAAALVVVGGATGWRNWMPVWFGSPDDAASDYVKLLADVRSDYVNGRVVEEDGWVLSQHEFDTINQRQQEAASLAKTQVAIKPAAG